MIQIREKNNDLHDSIIWAIRFDDKLYFDIDCIVDSKEIDGKIINSITPITLLFTEVENFEIAVKSDWVNGLEIDEITTVEENGDLIVKFIMQEGGISFTAKKYDCILKGDTIITDRGFLEEEERGGYNFKVK